MNHGKIKGIIRKYTKIILIISNFCLTDPMLKPVEHYAHYEYIVSIYKYNTLHT